MKKVVAVSVLLLIFAFSTFADVPKTINYQGRLRTAANQTVADGQYMITFRLYDADTAGTKVWEESQLVNTKQGYFNTILGNINAMSTSMFDKPLWLALKVGNEAEMTPRQALSATPHAFSIADGIVTTSKISDSAVTTAKISDGNITASKIADSAVTTSKIADGSITSAKLASTLSSGQIADNAITSAKIADGTISTCDIGNNTITSAKLADSAVTTSKIADNAITSAKIANGTIASADIGGGQINNTHIANGAIDTQAKAPWAPIVSYGGSQRSNCIIAGGGAQTDTSGYASIDIEAYGFQNPPPIVIATAQDSDANATIITYVVHLPWSAGSKKIDFRSWWQNGSSQHQCAGPRDFRWLAIGE